MASGGLTGLLACAAAAAVLALAAPGCGQEEASPGGGAGAGGGEPGAARAYDLSERARAGEALFGANCAACHGPGAAGTDQGPTFIAGVYHPGHHADFAFVRAVSSGVPRHHWSFGDMPPVPGLAEDEVQQIICYVREVQRANGLFSEEAYLGAC
ncbi:MAG: cytochrome c [Chloroflexi bacterium]|nr:cytochrome c [Chloroflexota bacterium]